MNNKEPDYVYILTNPSFRKDWQDSLYILSRLKSA